MILGLRTVLYKVDDLTHAKSWYEKAFGVKPYFDEPFYVGFNIGGYELGLQPEEGEISIKGNASIAYWGVEDVKKALLHLIDLGATIYEHPEDVGGGIVVASAKDPWGNIIGLIYNPHFKLP